MSLSISEKKQLREIAEQMGNVHITETAHQPEQLELQLEQGCEFTLSDGSQCGRKVTEPWFLCGAHLSKPLTTKKPPLLCGWTFPDGSQCGAEATSVELDSQFFCKPHWNACFINHTQTDKEVHHPDHYCVGGYECLEIIEALGLGYHLGNAFAYIWRAGRKSKAKEKQDIEKAIFYLNRHLGRL